MSSPEIIPPGPIAIAAERRCLVIAGGMICAGLKDHDGDHTWRDEDDVMLELPVLKMGGKR